MSEIDCLLVAVRAAEGLESRKLVLMMSDAPMVIELAARLSMRLEAIEAMEWGRRVERPETEMYLSREEGG